MDIKKLKDAADAAAGDVNWPSAQQDFVKQATPAAVLELIALVERQEAEHLATHRKLAAETLRADQGWQRYEEANADRNQLRAAMVVQAQCAAPDERAAFEAWAGIEYRNAIYYDTIEFQHGLNAWLARAALAAQPAKAEAQQPCVYCHGNDGQHDAAYPHPSKNYEGRMYGGAVPGFKEGDSAFIAIGKILDHLSQIQMLWGLGEPGALIRFSEVSNTLFAASKVYSATPAPAMCEELPLPESCDGVALFWTEPEAKAIRAYGRACMALRQPGAPTADPDRQDEAHKLARILFGMVEGGGPGEGVNIYSEGYSAPDGDVYVHRAAELLIEQAAESKELTRYVDAFARTTPQPAPAQPVAAQGEPVAHVVDVDHGNNESIISIALDVGTDIYTAPPPAPVAVPADAQGIITAAEFIEKRAEEYIQEHADTEHDTGAVVFHCGEAGREYHSGLVELAEEIRALAVPSAPVGSSHG